MKNWQELARLFNEYVDYLKRLGYRQDEAWQKVVLALKEIGK